MTAPSLIFKGESTKKPQRLLTCKRISQPWFIDSTHRQQEGQKKQKNVR
jgi:hypothetical protein